MYITIILTITKTGFVVLCAGRMGSDFPQNESQDESAVSELSLTSPMRGRGSSNHSVCVCVSVTALANATNALKAKVRYQQKALDAGNKINVGIELKILGSKVMTVISLPWNLYLALTAGNRRQQVTSVVRRISLVRLALRLHL